LVGFLKPRGVGQVLGPTRGALVSKQIVASDHEERLLADNGWRAFFPCVCEVNAVEFSFVITSASRCDASSPAIADLVREADGR
jgi:hypothetical protein